MAADVVAVRKAHITLSPDTKVVVQLTGAVGNLEVAHHGGTDSEAVYFDCAGSETSLDDVTVEGDETEVALPGERMLVAGMRGAKYTDGMWVALISAAECVVSVNGLG